MAEDRIDDLIDSKAIDAQFAAIDKHLQTLASTLKNFPKADIFQSGGSAKDLNGATNQLKTAAIEGVKANSMLNESTKAVISLVNQRFASEAKLVTVQTDYKKQTVANTLELSKQNAELKAQAQYNAANTGSIEKARAAIKTLSIERDKLNLFTKEGRDQQAKLNDQIDKYNNFIKKSVDSLSQQKINVGNYQGSAKIIVDALEKEKQKLEELEKTKIRVQNAGSTFVPSNIAASRPTVTGFSGGQSTSAYTNLGTSAKNADAEIIKLDADIEKSRAKIEGFSRITEQPKFLNIAGKVGDATQEVRFFTKSLIDLERNGLGNSEAANKLRANLAKLTDQIGDARAEVKALSSDTRTFDLFAGSVSFAADVFQTFAGAAVLAGASEEDAAEATKTLIAVQSVANGVKGIANELTTRGTAANKIYAFAQRNVALAMDETATAGARLKGVLLTIGIGALIIGIGLLIANFSKVKDALSGATAAQKEYNENQKLLTEIVTEGNKETGKQIADLKLLTKAAQDANLPMSERLDAVKQLQKEFPDYFKNLSKEAILTGDITKATNEATEAIIAAGRARAAKGKIDELENQQLDLDFEKEKLLLKAGKDLVEIRKQGAISENLGLGVTRRVTEQERQAIVNSNLKFALADIKDKKEALRRQEEFLTNFAGLGNIVKTVEDPDKTKTDKKARADSLQELITDVNHEFEIFKFNQDRKIKLFDQDVNDTEKSYTERLQALNNFIAAEKDLLDKEKQNVKDNLAKTAADKIQHFNEEKTGKSPAEVKRINDNIKKTEENLQKDLLYIDALYGSKNLELTDSTKKTRVDLTKGAYKEMVDTAVDAYKKIGKAIDDNAENEKNNNALDKNNKLLQLDKDLQSGRIKNLEQYNTLRQAIEDQATIADLEADEKKIKNQEIAFGKTLELELAFSDDELKIYELKNKYKLDSDKKLLEAKKNLAEQEKQLAFDVVDFVASAALGGIDKQKERLDKQSQDMDEKNQREIDAINASGLAQEEKARRITAIEKQSAFTHEQIQKKQEDLDKRRKQIEKLANIATIVSGVAKTVFELSAKAAEARAEAALLASNPITAAYAPVALAAAGIISAQIPFVIGSGALNLAKLAFFKEGTKNAPKGPAIVGEEGPELLRNKLGQLFLTPSRPTLIELAGGEQIFKHDVTMDILKHSNMLNILAKVQNAKAPQKIEFNYSEKMYGVLKNIEKKNGITIINKLPVESTAWYDKHFKN